MPNANVIIGHGAIGRGEQVQNAIALGARANTGGNQTISIGADSTTVSNGNISIGSQASSRDPNSLAIGTGAKSRGGSVAIGNAAIAENTSIVIGYSSQSKSSNGTVLGIEAVNASNNGTVLGFQARVNDNSLDGIAIGRSATVQARSQGGIAIGSGANIQGLNSLGIGTSAIARGSSVAIGSSARADNSSIVIGIGSVGLSTNGVVLGNQAINNGKDSTVIGYGAKLSGDGADRFRAGRTRALENSLVVGTDARAWSGYSVVLGREAQVGDANNDAVSGTAVGERAKALAYRSTALGSNALVNASGDGGIAIGRSALSNASQGIAIGSGDADSANNPATVNAEGGVAIGHNAKVDTDHIRAVAIGYSTTAGGAYNVVIGNGASASGSENVAIGRNSNATDVGERSDLVIGNKTFNANQWQGYNKKNSFAVASGGKERVIQHVAAGTISPNSTEAINGSQLYHIVNGIGFDVHDNAGAKKATVGIGNKLEFKKGTNNLVSVTVNNKGGTNGSKQNAEVVFDVITQELDSANNKTKVTAARGPAGLAKSADVAQAINDVAEALQKDIKNIGVSWKLATKAGTGGTANNKQHTITSNKTVTFQAGKNIALTQTDGTIDIAVSDTPSFTSMSTSGAATIGGKLTARGGLDVTGDTTLRGTTASTLNVTGATTLGTTTLGSTTANSLTVTNTANVGGMLNANGGLTVANRKTVDFNNNRLTEVGDATADTDAVNKKQLDAWADKGIKFWGDSNKNGQHLTRQLGMDIKITGGANEGQLTDNNIGVVVGNKGLEVKLSKTLTGLTSVTTNSLTVNNGATFKQGITLGNANNGPKIVNNGDAIKVQKNGGGYARITNIWDGKDAFDAVNKGQLDELANTGLQFEGDSASDVATRKLGQKLNITGGANRDKLTNNNIGVVGGSNGLVVKLAKNLKGLESVETKTLTTTGRITAGGGLTVTTGGLTVQAGKTNLNGGLTVTGDTKVAKLTATGDTQVVKLTATGDTSLQNTNVGGTLNVTGSTNLTNGLTVAGNTNVANLTATGNTSLNTITTTGAATINGTLNANGGLTVASRQTVNFNNNQLANVGNATADHHAVNKKQLDELANKGIKFLGDSTVVGQHLTRQLGMDIKITGGANEGQLTDNNIGVVVGNKGLEVKLSKTLTGLTSVTTNSLTVNNGATISGKLTARGGLDVSGGALTASSGATISGKLTANNDFEAKGATTLRSTLNVTGATTLRNTLNVTGATTANSLTVTNAASVGGMLNANGGLTVKNGFTASGTQELNFGGNKLTNIGNATANNHAVSYGQFKEGLVTINGIGLNPSNKTDGLTIEAGKNTNIRSDVRGKKVIVNAWDTKVQAVDDGVFYINENNANDTYIRSYTLGVKPEFKQKIQNLEDGIAAGLKFVGDDGQEVTRPLGETLKIVGEADKNKLTDGNIGVLKHGTDGLKVKLAKNLKNLESVATNTLTTTGAATIGGTLEVTGQSTFKDKVTVESGGLDVTGDTNLTGNLTVTGGNTTVEALTATGPVELQDTLKVDGQAQVESLVVDNQATFNGAVTANNGVTVANGDLKVTNGNTTLKTVTVNETLAVTGKTTLKETEVGGPLTVTGETTVENLTANGTTTLQKTDITGPLNVTGNTTVQKLTATGPVELQDTLKVDGQAQVESLVVDNQAILKKGVTLGDATGPQIVNEGNAIKVQTNNGGAARITNIADAVNQNDAVNKKQLDEKAAELTNTGLKFVGDDGQEVTRPLGETLKIVGEADKNKLTDGNIGVLKHGTDGLKVKLAKNLKNLESVATNTLTTTGAATIGGTLEVTGQSTFKDKVTVESGGLDVTGDTNLTGNLTVTGGNTTVEALTATGPVELQDTLKVDGQAQVESLVVDNQATFNGAVTANNGVTVANGDLKVTNGNTTLKTVTVNETLAVTGKTTLKETEVGGPLTVTGETTVENLTANGTTTLQKTDITGPLNVTGNTTVQKLTATGPVELQDTLKVDGQAQVESLVVDNQAILKKGVTLGDATGPQIVNEGNAIKVQTNNGGAARITNIADAVNQNDAVNKKQLDEKAAELTNTGLKFVGDDGQEVTRPLGETLKIVGEADKNKLTDGNIGVLKHGTDGLKVKLAKNLKNLESVATNTLTTTGAATIGGTLEVTGQSTFKDKVTVESGGLDVTGDTNLTGNLTVTGGNTTVEALTATGPVELQDTLKVDGQAQVESLVVDNQATFNGAVTANNGVTVANGDLKVTNGNTTLKTVTVNETLAVTGKTTLKETEVGGPLTVTGETTVENLTANGTTTLQKTDITGPLNVTGNTTVQKLTATGPVELQDTLKVDGQAQVESLVVDNQAILKKGVTLGDATGPQIVNEGNAIKVQTNNGGAARITNIADAVNQNDAVNKKQLDEKAAELTNTGLKFVGDDGQEVTRPLGETLKIVGEADKNKLTDGNIGVLKHGTDGLKVKLAKNLKNLESVATNTLTTTGAATIGGTLEVTGQSTFKDKVTVESGGLDVTGDTNLTGNLTVTGGNTTVQKLTATGPVELQDTLKVDGQAQVESLVVDNQAILKKGVTLGDATGPQIVNEGNAIKVQTNNGGAARITNIADAVNQNDAVNKKQLDEKAAELTNTGLKFVGDDGQEVTRPLGETLKIVGEADKNKLTDGNIGVLKHGTDGLKVKLAKNLKNLESVATNTLTTTGAATIGGTLEVTGQSTFKDKVTVESGGLDVTGDTNLTGNLTVTGGNTTVEALTATGPVELQDTLKVDGQAQVESLVVDNQATFNGAVTANNGVTVANGDLKVTNGNTTLKTVTVNETLAVTGKTTLKETEVGGPLTVTGETTVENLTANGTTTLQKTDITGPLNVTGNTTVQKLTATGPVELQDTLKVDGQAQVESLVVDNQAILKKGVTLGDATGPQIVNEGNAIKVQTNNGGAARITNIADAVNQNDAVNKKQLDEKAAELTNTGLKFVGDDGQEVTRPLGETLKIVGEADKNKLTDGNIGVLKHGTDGLKVKLAKNLKNLESVATNTLTTTGAATIGGTLEVTGQSTFKDKVTVESGGLDVTGDTNLTGNLTVTGGNTTVQKLTATGPVELQDTLKVDGQAQVESLVVDNQAILKKGVTLGDATGPQIVNEGNAIKVQTNNGGAARITNIADAVNQNDAVNKKQLDEKAAELTNTGLKFVGDDGQEVTRPLGETLKIVGEADKNKLTDGNIGVLKHGTDGLKVKLAKNLKNLESVATNTLTTTGAATIGGTLEVTGQSTFKDKVTVESGGLDVTGDTNLTGNLTVTGGNTTVEALTATGPVELQDTLKVDGQAQVESLVVDNQATFNGAVTANNGVTVANGDLKVTNGNTTLKTVTVNETLAVTGKTTLKETEVGGPLTVTGETTVENLTANGTTTLQKTDITGPLNVTGNTTVQKLTATGPVELQDTLKVDGQAQVESLVVDNQAILKKGVTLGDATGPQIVNEGNAIKVQTNNGGAARITNIADAVNQNDAVNKKQLDEKAAELTNTGLKFVGDDGQEVTRPLGETLKIVGEADKNKLTDGNIGVLKHGTDGLKVKLAKNLKNLESVATNTLTTTGAATIGGTLEVTGQSTFKDKVTVESGGLDVTGDTNLTGNLTVTGGNTTVEALTATGPVELQDTLKVDGQAQVESLVVDNQATFNGAVTANNGVTVANGDLKVTNGNTTLKTVTVNETLAVTGKTTLKETEVGGPLTVTGETTVENLTANGTTTLQKTDITGPLNVTGNTTVQKLTATGPVELQDTLKVDGQAQVESLVVDNQAILKKGVTLGDATGPQIVNEGNAIKVQTNNGGAARITNIADAVNQNDAVNKKQLDEKAAELTNTGLKFVGDDGQEVTRPLGETLKIVGEADKNKLTDGNIGVLKHGTDGLKVKLAKNLKNLESVATNTLTTTGAATIGGTLEVTGQSTFKDKVTVESGGLDVTGDTNLTGNLTVTGGNTTVQKLTATGPVELQDTLKVDGQAQVESLVVDNQAILKKGVTLGDATGPQIVNEGNAIKVQTNNGGAARITNIADAVNQNDAVNKKQLDEKAAELTNTGLKFVGDDGQEVTRPLGETLKIVGEADKNKLTDGNIGVLKHGTDGLKVKLAKNLKNLESVATNTLTTTGAATIGGTLEVTGQSTFKDKVTVESGGLDVTGDTNLTGNLTVTGGNTTVEALTATGPVELQDTLKVDGQAQVESLVVDNQATFNGAVTANNGVTVANGDLKVTNGNTTLKTVTVNETLAVTGKTTLKETEVGGPLTVTGETTVENLTANGTTTLQKTDITGPLNVTGNTTVQKLTATGPVELQDTLKVDGQAQVESLVVDNQAILKKGVTLGDATGPQIVNEGNAIKVQTNNGGAARITNIADAVNQNDAVNKKQLDEKAAELTNTGLKFVGDDGQEVTRPLGETLKIVGEADKNKLTDGNIGVLKHGTDGLKVKLAKNLKNLESVATNTLTTTGAATIGGTLEVTGQSTFKDKVTVESGGLDVTGDTNLTGNLTVTGGNTTVEALTATGPVELQDTLKVDGQAQVESLVVDNQATFNGAVTANNGVTVANGDLKVTNGNTTLKTVTVNETLAVTGKTTLKETEVGGPLTVTGETTVENLTANGTTTLQKTDITGPLNVTGNTTVQKLTATGPVELQDTLKVDGQAQVESLVVDNQAILKKGVTLGDATGPQIVNEGNAIKVQTNNGGAARITNIADAVNQNDAVNKKQLDEKAAELTNTGLKFVGDDGQEVTRPLGETLKIVGEADKNKLTDGNIGVLKHGTDGLKVKLAKNLKNLESVATNTLTTTGAATIGGTLEVTGQSTFKDKVTVESGGLDVTGDTNLTGNLTVTGGNTTVEALTATGPVELQDTLKVDGQAQVESLVVDNQAILKKGVTLGDATGPQIVNEGNAIKVQTNNGGAARITNIADAVNQNDAVNKKQLDEKAAELTNTGLKFVGDDGQEVTRPLGETLKIVGEADKNKLTDGNIGVLKHGTDGLKVKLAKNLKNLESVATNTLTTTGAATIGGTLEVTGQSTFKDKVTVESGGLDVTGDTNLTGNLTVTGGNTTVEALTATGPVELQDTLKVDGQAQVESLVVDNQATFNGAVTANNGVTVANGDLKVTNGNTTLKTVTVNETLAVTGKTTLKETEVGGPLTVTGETTVENLTANGTTTLQKTDITGPLNVTGNTTVQKLTATGPVELQDTLKVDGQAQVESLVVDNQAILKKGVTLGDATGPQIVNEGNAIKVQTNNGGAARITNIAAGEQDGDAVNFKQVKDGIAGITTKGLKFAGDINGEVHRELGQALTITGGVTQEGNLTDSNIGVVKNPNNQGLIVKLAKNLKGLESVTTNSLTVNNSATIGNGLTVTAGTTSLKDTTVDGTLKVTKGMDVKGKSTFDAIEIPSSKHNQLPLLLDNTGISGLPGNIAATADNTLSSDIDAKLDVSQPTDDPEEKAKRLSRAANIADVLSVGFNLKNNGASRDFIRGFDTVDFIDGKATTAVVTREGNSKTSKVTFNVNVDNDTIKLIDGNKIAANTTDLMVGNSGRLDIPMVSFDAIDNAKKLMTARDIAYAINQSGFQVISGQTGLGTNSGASEEVVRAGDLIKLIAGDNLDIKQEGTTFTFSLKKTLTLKDDKGDVTTLSPAGVKTQGNGGGSTLGNGGGSNVGGNGAGGGAVGNGGGESTVDKGGLTVADRDGNVSKVTANGVAVEGKNGSSSLEEGGLSVIGKDGSSSLEETGLSVAGKNGSSSLEEGGLSVIGKDGESSLKEGGLSVIGKNGSSSLEETGLSVAGKNGSSSLEEGGLSVIGKDGESSLKEGGLSVIGKDGSSSLSGDGVNVIDKDGNGGEFNAKGISLIGPKNQLNLQNNKLEMTATNAGKTNTFSIENTAEGAKVGGVADGVDPNDAVNKGQLDAQANKGLKFVGDDNQEVHRKLGETLTIVGGLTDATKLSDNNIGVMKDGDGKLVIKLAKNISGLSNIETTGRITAGNGLTVEAGGLNVKGDTTLQKTTVTDFTANGDTTLEKSLTVKEKATFKDAVEVNNGLTVTNGETKLKNTAVNGTLNVTGNTTIDKTLIVKGDTTVEKLTANGDTTLEKSLTVKEKATFKDAVEVNNGLTVTNGETKLKNTAVNGTLNVTGNTTIDKTLIVKGDTTVEKLTANGDTTLEKSLTVKEKATFKDTVEVNNGLTVTNGETKLKNTAVNGTLNVTGNTTIDKTLIVKGDTTVEKLTANGDTTLEKSLTVKEKATFKEGITLGDATTGPQIVHEGDDTIRIQQNDGSAARITNVADGHIAPDSKDIVNGGQLMNVYNHIGKIESQLQAGIAGNNAAASLPQVMMPGKSMVSAALGGFRDKKAIAIGYSRLSDNGRMALKSNLNVDTEKNLGYGVGVGFTW
ncbi:YadA-like family protein [Moraxella sp. ZY200743]|uniref:YadA-like family protein n=1 Tax=Moraxella sp. ZY200743 TaxID=2911970 RepID=UPI003D7E9C44